ncbi:MAG: IS1634 family transposase [Myxococcota bacterium]
MHLNRVRNQNGVETVLVRETYREDGKVRKRTLANVTHLPPQTQELIARSLAGEALVPASAFEIEQSRQHGHVEAVVAAMRKLKLDRLLCSTPCRERDLAMTLIAARILEPDSKLGTTRWWRTTTLLESLGIDPGTSENDLYRAMDWLEERQPAIEARLAKRHLEPCGLVLYDLTSTYVEGTKCDLAARGHNRDGKHGKLQVNFGMITDEDGRPISVSIYPGNTADPSTVQDQIHTIRNNFGIDLFVFVGDRGMIAQTAVDRFKEQVDVEWITALKSGAIAKLHAGGDLQMSLFDKRDLFEFTSPQFPGERLVACRNPLLADRRARKRIDMLNATRRALAKVRRMVRSGRLKGRDAIGVRVGRVINKYKMAKHFKLTITDTQFRYRIRRDSVAKEASVDGLYVIRTSVPEAISTADVVRHYKRLTKVEKDFRAMKMTGLEVRPIYHRTERRVRAHIFLCMLALYVRWHMQRAWRPLLFAEETDTLPTRDPVKPAKPTRQATAKKSSKKTTDDLKLNSFCSLLRNLATITKNTCRTSKRSPTFEVITRRSALQARALKLINAM